MRIEPANSNVADFNHALAPSFIDRVAAYVQSRKDGTDNTPSAPVNILSNSTEWTSTMLRDVLLGMRQPATLENIDLIDAFAKSGLPITESIFSEAHAALAAAPGASSLSYALAKSWDLPSSPAILRALTAVTIGANSKIKLPQNIVDWLSISLDVGMQTEELTGQLGILVKQVARSTENRLLKSTSSVAISDTVRDVRSILLRLADVAVDQPVRRAANHLAAHIEGQQLINQASNRLVGGDQPIYFAMPANFGTETAMIELQMWPSRESDEDDNFLTEINESYIQATVRLTTDRLGTIQISIAGTTNRRLACDFVAERPATARLLVRHSRGLTQTLSEIGWPETRITCKTGINNTPMWFGGDAANHPRAHIDRRV